MLSSIDSLIEILKNKHFKKDWIEDRSNYPDLNDFKLLAINKIINAAAEVYTYYILLLLSGEYLKLSLEKHRVDIDTLQNYLGEVSLQIELPAELIQNELQTSFVDNLIHPIKFDLFAGLDVLLRDINGQINLNENVRILRFRKKNHDVVTLAELSTVLHIALAVTRLEHLDFRAHPDVVKKLLLLQVESSSLTISRWKDSLLNKVNFLLYKLLISYEHPSNSNNIVYAFDDQDDEELTLQSLNLPDEFKEWKEIIQSHEGIDSNFKHTQRLRAAKVYKKSKEDYTYEDYRTLIKQYKDDTREVEQTRNLLRDFKENVNDGKLLVDEYAKKVTISYIYNNSISLELEDLDMNENRYRELYNEIRNHQNENFVRNYFPWRKLCDTLYKRIDNVFNNKITPVSLSCIRKFFSVYSDSLSKFNETLTWSKNRGYIPFQRCFHECRSPYEIDSEYGRIRLFFFSSVVLPLNYQEIEKHYNLLDIQKVKFETLLSTHESLSTAMDGVDELVENVRKQERRSIETLSIFSAIALFSVGSIQIASNGDFRDGAIYFKFILSYGYCLCLFVLLIWIITRPNISKVHWLHILLVLVVVVSSLLVINFVTNFLF